MTANLTRDEARTRAELIKVRSYRVELDLAGGDTTFRSISTVAFDCARPGSGTFLNLEAPQVHSITLNGAPVTNILFAGLTPTLVGLYQVDFQVPANAPNGDLQLVLTQPGGQSNVTILPVHD